MAIKIITDGEPNPIEARGQEQGRAKREQIPKRSTRDYLSWETGSYRYCLCSIRVDFSYFQIPTETLG